MMDLRRARRAAGLFLLVSALAVGSVAACKRARSGSPSPGASTSSSSSSAATAGSAAREAAGLPPAIPSAAASANRARPALRACFADQLRRSSVPVGTVTFTIVVGGDGHVVSAVPKSHDGLDDACLSCMTEGVKAAVFERPLDGLPATVIAPFTFNSVRDRRPPGSLPSAFLPPDVPER